MDEQNSIEEEIEKTLSAYDKDPILEGNPYLLTRIQEKRKNVSTGRERIVLRANLVLIILVLLINAATLFFYLNKGNQKDAQQQLLNNLKEEFQIEQSQNEL